MTWGTFSTCHFDRFEHVENVLPLNLTGSVRPGHIGICDELRRAAV